MHSITGMNFQFCNLFGMLYPQLITKIAMKYSDQVKLDFVCFEDYVKKNFR
jgi:hypothetical protein